MRKVLSLLLAFAMLFSIAGTALAGSYGTSKVQAPEAQTVEKPEEFIPQIFDPKDFSLSLFNKATKDDADLTGKFYGMFNDMTDGTVTVGEYDLAQNTYTSYGTIEGYLYAASSMKTTETESAIYGVVTSQTEWFDTTNKLVRFDKFENGTVSFTELGDAPSSIIGLAKSYKTNNVYAMNAGGVVYMVDLDKAEFTEQFTLSFSSWFDGTPASMTMDEKGDMYVVTTYGLLYRVDPIAGTMTNVGDMGYSVNYQCSLAFDFDSNELYWFYIDGAETNGVLKIDRETAEVTYVKDAARHQAFIAFTMADNAKLPEAVDPTEVQISETALNLITGQAADLTATVLPLDAYVKDRNVTWTSDKTTVATVENGHVVAVAEGTATITAASSKSGVKAECVVTVVSADGMNKLISEAFNKEGNDTLFAVDFSGDFVWEALTINEVDHDSVIAPTNLKGIEEHLYTETGIMEMPEAVTIVGGSTVSFEYKMKNVFYGDQIRIFVNGEQVEVINGWNRTGEWETFEWTAPRTGEYKIGFQFYREGNAWNLSDATVMLDNFNIDMQTAEPVKGVKLSSENGSIALIDADKGYANYDVLPLTTTIDPVNSEKIEVTYTSSNDAIATVDENGVVTGLSAGTATITVTVKGEQGGTYSDTFTVDVRVARDAFDEFAFSNGEMDKTYNLEFGGEGSQVTWFGYIYRNTYGYKFEMAEGSGVVFNLNVEEGTSLYDNHIFTLLDENFNELQTSWNAEFKFVPQTAGTYYLLVSAYGGYNTNDGVGKMEFIANSYEPVHVESVEVDMTEVSLGLYSAHNINVTLLPENNDYPGYTFESSNPKVATVDARGKVFAKKAGEAVITVTSNDGGHTAEVTVTVGSPDRPDYDGMIYAFNQNNWWDNDNEVRLMGPGFVKIDPENPAEIEMVKEETQKRYYSALYYDGMIYAYSYYDFLGFITYYEYTIFDPFTFEPQNTVTVSSTLPLDLTYDYTTDTAYGVAMTDNAGDIYLVTIDLATGEFNETWEMNLENNRIENIEALTDGTLLAMDVYGTVYEVNKETAELTKLYTMDHYNSWGSMVYDHHKESMYWFAYDQAENSGNTSSRLVEFDPKTGKILSDYDFNDANAQIFSLGLVGGMIFTNPDELVFPEPTVPVTGITVDPESLTMDIGEIAKVTATVAPENATDKNVTWTSDNTAVATVDEYGNVTAVAAGSATITVTTEDGEFTATVAVTVNEKQAEVIHVESITLTPEEITLKEGETAQFTATVMPENATYKDVTWSSNNEAIVTVDQEGNITAVHAGTAIIEVKSVDGGLTATATVTVEADIDPDDTTYTVTFLNYDGSVYSTVVVKEGEDAPAPQAPVHPNGIPFGVWDTDFTNVESDLTVKPITVGDVNRNYGIDAGDATLILREVVGNAELDEVQLMLADANGNNEPDAGDATIVLRYVVSETWGMPEEVPEDNPEGDVEEDPEDDVEDDTEGDIVDDNEND